MTKQKPWNAKNGNDYWAICDNSGQVAVETFGASKNLAINNFLHLCEESNCPYHKNWKHAVKYGYRAVKIRIVEIE